MVHFGRCACGAVELEVTGQPEAMGYCHCGSCRPWSGGSVNAFGLWKPEAVRVTAGAEHVVTLQKSELGQRRHCARCGGYLMTSHPPLGLVDVFVATVPSLAAMPGVPANDAGKVPTDAVWPPKTRDLPGRIRRLRRKSR